MAVRSKLRRAFDPQRHVRATKIELSFFESASPDKWRQFVEDFGCSVETLQSEDSTSPWLATFVALPEKAVPGAYYLSGEAHLHIREPVKVHWVLTSNLVPNSSPPQSFIESSRKVGGYPGVLDRLARGWPSEGPLSAHTKIVYVLDPDVWVSPFTLRKSRTSKALHAGKFTANLEMEAYVWKVMPKGALEKVSDLGDAEGGIVLSVEGGYDFELGSGLMMEVEHRTWDALAEFLRKRTKRS